jgi:hypothetical protein
MPITINFDPDTLRKEFPTPERLELPPSLSTNVARAMTEGLAGMKQHVETSPVTNAGELYVPLGIYSHRARLTELFASIDATLNNQSITYKNKSYVVQQPLFGGKNQWAEFVAQLPAADERRLRAELIRIGYRRA